MQTGGLPRTTTTGRSRTSSGGRRAASHTPRRERRERRASLPGSRRGAGGVDGTSCRYPPPPWRAQRRKSQRGRGIAPSARRPTASSKSGRPPGSWRTSSKHSGGTPSSGGTPRTAWDVPCGTPSSREGQRRADPRCANADGLALHGCGQTVPRQGQRRADPRCASAGGPAPRGSGQLPPRQEERRVDPRCASADGPASRGGGQIAPRQTRSRAGQERRLATGSPATAAGGAAAADPEPAEAPQTDDLSLPLPFTARTDLGSRKDREAGSPASAARIVGKPPTLRRVRSERLVEDQGMQRRDSHPSEEGNLTSPLWPTCVGTEQPGQALGQPGTAPATADSSAPEVETFGCEAGSSAHPREDPGVKPRYSRYRVPALPDARRARGEAASAGPGPVWNSSRSGGQLRARGRDFWMRGGKLRATARSPRCKA